MTEQTYTPQPGDQVRVRRYDVPCPELPDGPKRKLLIEMTGTVAKARPVANGVVFTLEGDDEPIFSGSQFTGQDPYRGCSWTLRTEVTSLETDDQVAAIVDAWYERYASASRIDEDVYLALRNRLIPIEPGTPVQFRELGRTRWFFATFEGPVDNPDDPRRSGDAVVRSRSGRRVSVFLSSVRRAS